MPGIKKMIHDLCHDQAIRLIEGGAVMISGHSLVAVELKLGDHPCDFCELDSACTREILQVCAECDSITNRHYFLDFAYKHRRHDSSNRP